MIVPFTLNQPFLAAAATAGVNLFIGLSIGVLVSMSAALVRTAGPSGPALPRPAIRGES